MEHYPPTLRQRILDWLSRHVPESRLSHVLRVEEMSIELAQRHQLSVTKAAQAGLMHDLAKYFKPAQLLSAAQAANITIDPVYEANPHLLHADVSAIVAQQEFGIDDPDILDAIANHTLGRPGMSALSCTVFLADSLEPGRGKTPELNHLRAISRESLSQAVWMTCDYTLRHLMNTHRLIHPRALATRNWFLQSAKSGEPLEARLVEYTQQDTDTLASRY